MKKDDKVKKMEKHYYKNDYAELPKIRLIYADSNRSYELETSDYQLQNAFEFFIYILDKRIKKENSHDEKKDKSIG